MKKLSPSVIAILGFLICFLAGYWLLVIPETKAIGEFIQKQQQNVASSGAGVTQQKKAKPLTVDDIKRQQALSLLPDSDNQYDLAIQIEGLSKSLAIPLGSIAITSQEPNLGPKTTTAASADAEVAKAVPVDGSAAMSKLTVNLSISAPYTDVQRFINGLIKINRLVQIDQVTLSSSGSDPSATPAPGQVSTAENSMVAAQIVAFAYFLPQQ